MSMDWKLIDRKGRRSLDIHEVGTESLDGS